VEILSPAFTLPLSNDVYRNSTRGPHVIEVDASGHDCKKDLTLPRSWSRYELRKEGGLRLAHSLLPHDLCMHHRRNITQWGQLADGYDV
jgi:hypothetical protein